MTLPEPTSHARLGIGCAELFSEPSRTARRRLLECAWEAGISHFDVAPMYGLGLAEFELGRFAKRRRDRVSIATKFGIAPAPAARVIAPLQGPIRRILAAAPALRSRAGESAPGPGAGGAGSLLYRVTGHSAAAARASLERSLRALRTDYVDLFLLHDPPAGLPGAEDLCAYLEEARNSGTIRAWGVAGELGATLAVMGELPTRPPAIQIREDILVRRPVIEPAPEQLITFGLLGRGIAAVGAHLAGDPARRGRWHDAVGVDCSDPEVLSGLLLRWAAAANPGGVVLFSTIRAAHIAAAPAALATRAGDLDAFTGLIDAELRPPREPRAEL